MKYLFAKEESPKFNLTLIFSKLKSLMFQTWFSGSAPLIIRSVLSNERGRSRPPTLAKILDTILGGTVSRIMAALIHFCRNAKSACSRRLPLKTERNAQSPGPSGTGPRRNGPLLACVWAHHRMTCSGHFQARSPDQKARPRHGSVGAVVLYRIVNVALQGCNAFIVQFCHARDI